MDQHQQELRRAAARAFMQSLDQLQETLQSADGRSAPLDRPTGNTPSRSKSMAPPPADLVALEQAAADIEQFIQAKHPEPPESKG